MRAAGAARPPPGSAPLVSGGGFPREEVRAVCQLCSDESMIRCDCGETADLLNLLALDLVCLDHNCLGNCDRWHFV